MEKLKKKSSIATKMIIFILFVTVLVASLASSFIISQDYQKEMKRVEESMIEITDSSMPTLALALYSEDEEQIAHVLKGILKVEGIVEVRVRLEDEDKDAYGLVQDDLKKIGNEERRTLGPSKLIKIMYK